MRKILSLLKQSRCLQLQKAGALTNDKFAELGQLFGYLDSALWGVRVNEAGGLDGPERQLQEVMISADFTYAIQEFVQRLMWPAYNTKTFAFEAFVKPDTLPNYLPVTRYQNRGSLDDLEYVGEKGEARPGHVDDATKRQYQVYKWEKQYDFSMEALVNDDLGYFQDHAEQMGRSARRSLEKYVSRMLWNATTIARLVGLGALYSTTGRFTTARLSTARMAFNQRTDARGNPVASALRFIVYPPASGDTVELIRTATNIPDQVGTVQPGTTNIYRSGWTAVEDPHSTAVAPNLPWMALASWQESGMIPFVLARRQGMPAPLLLRKKSDIESITSLLGAGGAVPPVLGDFATSNVVVKVWDEWGTYIDHATEGNLFDFRGAYYSSGTVA